ncbi:chorismate--pyruvate lyase family protein [Alteromonas facilis]|uniref:chorismate--pyruvate lyase family protein n=1 Tax=Alteromonas facilis TaxID=2048004 RepID=UPI001F0CD7FA|nr:chorismate lyase [Alteromonas facilis]
MSLSAPLDIQFDWYPHRSVPVSDPYLANWLLDTGSLTERLQSMCRQFQVQVLCHQQQPQQTAGAGNPFIRDVLLLGDGQPWVFARSVIPEAINNGELLDLGSQPLGQRIFNDPRFVRGEFELCSLSYERLLAAMPQPYAAQLVPLHETSIHKLFGRRSSFTFLHYSMSVAEIFLPQSPAYLRE